MALWPEANSWGWKVHGGTAGTDEGSFIFARREPRPFDGEALVGVRLDGSYWLM